MAKRVRRARRRGQRGELRSGGPHIQASVRRPLTSALGVGVASMMLTTGALAQSGTDTLPTIEVQGDTGGGYQATQSSMSRMPTPLLNTPQTVNVVTQKVIQDQRSNNMVDDMRYVPGVTFTAGEGGQQGG